MYFKALSVEKCFEQMKTDFIDVIEDLKSTRFS